MKRLLIISAVFMAVTLLVGASYMHARARSDGLIAKLQEPWERIGSRFVPFRIISDRSVRIGYMGPCWEFDYDPKHSFPVGPLSVRMSFLGNPMSTNPGAALAELQKHP